MVISKALIDELTDHARDEAPNECCGLLGGRDGRATSVRRGENLHASPLRFEIANPLPLLNAIEDDGEELVAIYHSHTRSEAYPSQTDVNLARLWPDPLWVICSLADPERPVVRAFAIRDGEVEEVGVEVDVEEG
jgi:[CysO sulfur-carrier protein]-S-L-cysteine hydrolase